MIQVTRTHKPKSVQPKSISNFMDTSIVANVVNRIFTTRTISKVDQQLLMTLLNKSVLSETDMNLVNQVYVGLHDGHLRVAD